MPEVRGVDSQKLRQRSQESEEGIEELPARGNLTMIPALLWVGN
jgi:hypothetical protein